MPKRRKTSEKTQRLTLTDSLIRACRLGPADWGLPIKDRDYTIWDRQVGGFGVQIYRSGVKNL